MRKNSTLTLKIQRHPTVAFFVFAFVISWTAWFLAPLVGADHKALSNLIDLMAAFGPALSAISVSATLNPQPSGASAKKRWATFLVLFAVTYIFQVAALTVGVNFSLETALTAAATSILASYVVSCVYHPKQGVANLMAGLKRFSPKSIWVWAAALLPFIWQIIGAILDSAFGGVGLSSFSASAFVLLLATYPSTFFFGGPLNEEPGWRGFATPRLQRRLSPLVTGLLVGFVWSVWHFPLHVTVFYGDGLSGFLFRFLYNVPFGVLFTWLYNRSGGNLFACILLHASINTSSLMFSGDSALIGIAVMIAFTAAVALIDKMYRKPAPIDAVNSASVVDAQKRFWG